MPEALLFSFAGWLLLAATSHRLRREAGVTDRGAVRSLRVLGAVLLSAAWWFCRGGLPGEHVVRFLIVAGIAAIAVTLLLSAARQAILRPIARILALRGR